MKNVKPYIETQHFRSREFADTELLELGKFCNVTWKDVLHEGNLHMPYRLASDKIVCETCAPTRSQGSGQSESASGSDTSPLLQIHAQGPRRHCVVDAESPVLSLHGLSSAAIEGFPVSSRA